MKSLKSKVVGRGDPDPAQCGVTGSNFGAIGGGAGNGTGNEEIRSKSVVFNRTFGRLRRLPQAPCAKSARPCRRRKNRCLVYSENS